MTMTAASPQPKPQEIDLGPIRIEGCTYVKNSTTSGQYILTLRIGESMVEVAASLMGKIVHVYRDGIALIDPSFPGFE
jgi:hypothetical protein